MKRKSNYPGKPEGSLERDVMPPLIPGTKTQWGTISAVGFLTGERYYWITGQDGCVAMLPADVVEQRHNDQAERRHD